MIKKLYILFKLGRKLAKSDALSIFTKFHNPPIGIKILFYLLSLSFSKKDNSFVNETEGERLSNSLQSMGTTFIKLGQFLATRPDIIGEKLSKQLESLQDRLPPFELSKAKEIIKKDLGEDNFNSIINLSEPVAAASIAQVHKAQINDNGTIKDVAIKILRPNIKKIFNEEIDALMLFAFLTESIIKKTKRLKLVEVVYLLKEITNLEMDLRFEAAAANEYSENTKNDSGFQVPRIYWNFTSENVMTLDWVEGVSIRETEELEKQSIDGKNLSEKVSEPDVKKLLAFETSKAIEQGVFGVPTVIIDGNLFWGNDQIEHIELLLAGKDPLDRKKLNAHEKRDRAIDRKILNKPKQNLNK